MLQDIHQRDHAAVAPSDHTDAFGIQKIVIGEHPFPCEVNVVDLVPAVIDLLIQVASIAAAPAVIRRDHSVTLLHQLAHHVS